MLKFDNDHGLLTRLGKLWILVLPGVNHNVSFQTVRERVECFFSINLTRHSDLHAFAHRPYPILRHFSESPELPVGYDMLPYAAFYPKLLFKIMDPAVDDVMNKLREWHKQGVGDYKRVMTS